MNPKIEVLVSTMNLEKPEELIKNMNISGSSVIINQITKEDKKEINVVDTKNRVFSYYEKGLSRSRNKAILNSKGDICVVADDDITYVDKYEEIITNAYKKYPDADIIAFYIKSNNDERPTTKQKEGKVGYLRSMKIASCQITFKLKSIKKHDIKFDELYGVGSGKYKMGEENIMLFDAIGKKMKIYYVSDTIAKVDQSESTWFNGYDEEYFIAKGACYYRMTKKFWWVLVLQFAVRKYSLYKNSVSFWHAIKTMFKSHATRGENK